MDSGIVTPLRSYVVIGRSVASAIFEEGHCAVVDASFAGCPCEVTFRTRYVDAGSGLRVPQELYFEVRGRAEDILRAVEGLGNVGRSFTALLAVTANASMGDPEVELAYEDTPGAVEHQYFQAFVERGGLTPIPNRKIETAAFVKLVDAIGASPEQKRLVRAVGQYDAALANWRLGQEILCVEHLFMGHEALKPTAVRRVLEEKGVTKEQLGTEWGFDPERWRTLEDFLQTEARSRGLFRGDTGALKRARSVSDGFEHGFEDFPALRQTARGVFETAARYLREAIIEYSGVDDATRAALLRVAEPRGRLEIVRYLWGTLACPSGELAATGHDHPCCDWKVSIKEVKLDNEGRYTVTFDDKMTPRLGPAVKLQPQRYEAWDGSKLRQQEPPTAGK